MKKMIKIHKNLGETPLETIERFKRENPEYAHLKMTYAGRLDPMAEGQLILLVGDECKNKEKYLKLDKEYDFEVLWGFSTDTHDILGLIDSSSDFSKNYLPNSNLIKESLKSFTGKIEQEYPLYSSKIIANNLEKLNKKIIQDSFKPRQLIEIYSLEFLGNYFLDKDELKENIFKRISLLSSNNNFRQKVILDKWLEVLNQISHDKFYISKHKTKCSSGAYVRKLSYDLGVKLGFPTLAFGIKRITLLYQK